MQVKQLAALVQGQVHGKGELHIHAARPLQEAGPGDITFLENQRHLRRLDDSQARVLVVPAALVGVCAARRSADGEELTLIAVKDPLLAFARIVQRLHGLPPLVDQGIDPHAIVHPTARLGEDVRVHPFAVVGEGSVLGNRCRLHCGVIVGRYCRIGDDVELYPHAVLYDGTVLGHRVIVHAGAVLGADGFGYRLQEGRHSKVPQLGWVEIGDDVEIGAGTTIDRGTFQPTRVGTGTKIDNLVQIGHNCQIGRHNLLVAQVGIAGSTTTGDYVVMAGQVGVSDHLHVGHRAVLGGRAGVTRDIPDDGRVLGTPARPEVEEKRIILSLDRLPQLCRDVRQLQQHLGLARPRRSEDSGTGDEGEVQRDAS